MCMVFRRTMKFNHTSSGSARYPKTLPLPQENVESERPRSATKKKQADKSFCLRLYPPTTETLRTRPVVDPIPTSALAAGERHPPGL